MIHSGRQRSAGAPHLCAQELDDVFIQSDFGSHIMIFT